VSGTVKDCLIGDIYLIKVDGQSTTQPKPTMCLCICENSFFAIHTEEMYSDNLPINKSEHQFLDHDSHIKCGITLVLEDHQIIIKHYGSISNNFLEELIEMVDGAEGLYPKEKRPILESLRNLQLKRSSKKQP
jgi:hypothetical protein